MTIRLGFLLCVLAAVTMFSAGCMTDNGTGPSAADIHDAADTGWGHIMLTNSTAHTGPWVTP